MNKSNLLNDFNILSEFDFIKKYFDLSPSHAPKNFTNLFKEIKTKYFRCLVCKNIFLKPSIKKCCVSKECQSQRLNKMKELTSKIKQTKLERYGNSNYCNTQKIAETKDSNNPNWKQDVSKKIKETKSSQDHSQALEKRKQTCLEKFGVDNYFKIKNFSILYPHDVPKARRKTKETWLKKYGVSHPSLRHLKNLADLSKGGFRQFINADNLFDVDACAKHFDVDLRQVYKYKIKFDIKAPNINSNQLQQNRIFESINCDDKMQNNRSILKCKEIDIYLPSIKLGIEYNGLLYHSEGAFIHPKFENKPFDYHLNKTLECESEGIQLFHIFESEDLDIWLSMIHNKLGMNKKIYARDCRIMVLSNNQTKDFLNKNHLQGFMPAKINLALVYFEEGAHKFEDDFQINCLKPKVVSIMTFSKPRFNKGYEYELIRFCSLKHHNVLGAASKLFKYFIRVYNPKSIISYANRRFSNGDIYKTLGFTLKSVSQPNYFYFNTKDFILESRNKYQKHKLEKYHLSGELDYFNKNESEAINMFKNGYRRIFDCGNLVFEWFKK